MKRKPQSSAEAPQTLKGWKAIASYLGITAATAQRWAKEGMPVERQGRFTVANVDALRQWLGREAHMPAPAHVMTRDADVQEALKESISAGRKRKR